MKVTLDSAPKGVLGHRKEIRKEFVLKIPFNNCILKLVVYFSFSIFSACDVLPRLIIIKVVKIGLFDLRTHSISFYNVCTDFFFYVRILLFRLNL